MKPFDGRTSWPRLPEQHGGGRFRHADGQTENNQPHPLAIIRDLSPGCEYAVSRIDESAIKSRIRTGQGKSIGLSPNLHCGPVRNFAREHRQELVLSEVLS